jgi:hypothetical protein
MSNGFAVARRQGKIQNLMNRRFLMTTTTNKGRRATATLLSLLCAGLFALSLGGCAEAYYTDAYYTPDYRYRTYYGPDYYPYYPYYSYYGGAYYYGD